MTPADQAPLGQPQVSGDRSIAAGSIGVAITGDNARIVMLPPEAVRWARETTVPPGAGYLPNSASGAFVGRDQELLRLREKLTNSGHTAVTHAWAIHGLGGVGKSTLALHYAHRYRDEYTLVWWITAESPEQIDAGLSSLTRQLCPQWAATADPEEHTAWAMTWLQWHPGWLLVFDNVENPEDLRPYLGTLPTGHHLATSRKATGWHAIAPTMPLGLLDPAASADLLCGLALDGQPPTPEQWRHGEALAKDLGYLPLALEQAGAYLHQTATGMDVYRQALGLMLAKAADGINPERTIARVWDQTLKAITARNPLAVALLHTLAWLAPDNIPRILLTSLASDPYTLDEALGALRAYNMITLAGPDITVHRLVQAVLRTGSQIDADTPPPGRREAERTLLQALRPDGNGQPAPPERWQYLIPHVIALAASAPAGYYTDDALSLYDAATAHLRGQGQRARAIPLLGAMLAWCEGVLGDTHPNTLNSRNNLALAYEEGGDLSRAIPLHEATLAQYERVLGDTHPDTLQSRNNLAGAYKMAGDLARAISLHEAALAQRKRVLGDTHPDTLQSRNNLAVAYETAGDLSRAIPLYEATLAQHQQALGDDHPGTLRIRINLAGVYRAAGNLGQAIPLLETTLAQYERVLGDTHPDTLQSRNNLALAYETAGDLSRAIPLYEATLAQRERVLGDTHPDTLQSRNNLAVAYQVVGDLGRALPLHAATLAQRERVLGDTHPDTLQSRNDLAVAYGAVGDLGRALPLLEATLAQRERVLGDTHPHTLQSRNSLSGAYYAVGDLGRAIPLLEATLAQRERVLGDTHPHTLNSRNNLAVAYEAAGDLSRAIPLYEATLAERERVLGDTHPHTLQSRNSLSGAYEVAQIQAVQQRSTATTTTVPHSHQSRATD
ncbi:tetratricopeptide repeat protein [Streptomyces sp. NPDC046931]|uniref:tetratricopeptide repeat protein n=1 Tax=Streptomyces sp. NPDC046931 TaxID=3154806 RepID=UPI0033E56D0B